MLRLNFTLQVGQLTDTITITEEAPAIQSESAELGTVIDNKTVLETPLNGREFYALLKLVPGTVAPAPNSTLAHRGGVTVAGARDTSNSYMIDGIDNGSAGTNGPQIKIGVETLQEFKLLTNSYSPEFGRGGGGQIVMTTRSGTNEYRGTVWNFLRNDVLDARNFFDPVGRDLPPLRRNQFGFVFGGPFPELENLHFFTGFEGLRNRKSLTSGATVPAAAFHDGDFSSLLPGTIIRDPMTGDAFPGNIIPQEKWDPLGKQFLDLYPNPTNSRASRNLISNPKQNRDNDQATARIDYSFGPHNVYARHIYNRELIAEAFQGRGTENGVPGFGWFNTLVGNTFSIGATLVYSPSLIGSVRYGITTMWEPVISANVLGFNPFVETPPDAVVDESKGWFGRDLYIRPGIRPSGFDRVGDRSSPGGRQEYINEFNYTQKYITGNHTLTGGYHHRVIMIDHFLPFSRAGDFRFDGIHSGHPVSDLLLGFARQSSRTAEFVKFRTHQRGRAYSAFFNDDWKVTANLTLNLGFRYEINTPMYDAFDVSLHSFNFDTAKVIVPDPSLLDPRLLAPEFVEGSQHGRGLRPTDYNNISPRLGIAYSLNDRTVIRAGYGMFTDNIAFGNHQTGLVFGPWASTKTYRTDSSTGPAVSLSNNPFPDEIFRAPLLSVRGWTPDHTEGYVQNWNLTIQRELRPDLVLETAYMGSKGSDLMTKLEVNQAVRGSGPTQARRAFPTYSSVRRYENTGYSNFHALQFKLDKRFSGGLQLLGNYMWSKALDSASTGSSRDVSVVQDFRNPAAEYGLSNFDTRHRFVTNFVYEIPLGSGHTYLRDGALSHILGGWQVSGILTLQAGRPVTAQLVGDWSRTGGRTRDRPHIVGDPNKGPKTPNSFWNENAFALPERGTFGNGGRNTLIGPGMRQFDMAVMKNFPLGSDESRRVQFRMEAFNIFNHPVFGQPNGTIRITGNELDFDRSNYGVIRSTLVNTTARQIQLGLKIYF
jgi:hypothetical protein